MIDGFFWRIDSLRWWPVAKRKPSSVLYNAQSIMSSRRTAAATQLRNLFGAFSAGSSSALELRRISETKMARLKEAGRAVCAQAEDHRMQYRRSIDELRLRDDLSGKKWALCHEELSILEWSCNAVESGMGFRMMKWTEFRLHSIDCGKPGTECRCLSRWEIEGSLETVVHSQSV